MNAAKMREAATLFFTLLRDKTMDDTHPLFVQMNDSEIREGVLLLARQSSLEVVEAYRRLHLIAKSVGGVFETTFTDVKKKYSHLENKKYFHLSNIILMTLLSEFDRSPAIRHRFSNDGLTFYELERLVTSLFERWRFLLANNPASAATRKIDMQEMISLWSPVPLDDDELDSVRRGSKRGNRRTRIGFIAASVKLLSDEGLVFVADFDVVPKIFPKPELFERLEHVYYQYDRFLEMKAFMTETKELLDA